MPTFKIQVTRIGYAIRFIEVEAVDEPQARRLALETAGNYQFTEHDAEYELADGSCRRGHFHNHSSKNPEGGVRHQADLIHVIFNGGQSDESQGIVSLRQKAWLFYTWGTFSRHHANGDVGVITLGITDSDFKLLLARGDDPNICHDLATWDHVVELLTCPAFRLGERLGGEEFLPIELLVVVKGEATGQPGCTDHADLGGAHRTRVRGAAGAEPLNHLSPSPFNRRKHT